MKDFKKEKLSKNIKNDLKKNMQSLSHDEIKLLLKKFNLKPESKLKLSNIYELIDYINWDLLSKEINPSGDNFIEYDGRTYPYSFFQEKKIKTTNKEKQNNKRYSKRRGTKERNMKINQTNKKTTLNTKTEKTTETKPNKKTTPNTKTEKTTETKPNKKTTRYNGNLTKYEEKNLKETSQDEIDKANERLFSYPKISELKIFHALFSDIYFLYDYIPSDRRKDYKEQNVKLSKDVEECMKIDEKLMKYKNEKENVEFFTKPLLKSIKDIFKIYFKDKKGIALVSVPPSDKRKTPQTKGSIELIEKMCKTEKNDIDFEIYNSYNLLIRVKTVVSSKKGDRPISKHQDSIGYEDENRNFSKKNTGIIILDDITTSGNSMYACRDILIEHGYENKDIISLALARTVNRNSELTREGDETIIKYEEDRVERN